MKGVPLRLEIGPRDLENEGVTAVRRDTGEKAFLSGKDLPVRLPPLLQEIQDTLYRQALEFRQRKTYRPVDYNDFKRILEEDKGFLLAHWCGDPHCEEEIKTETKATIRCIPFDKDSEDKGPCLYCRKEGQLVYFARAY